MAGQNPKPVSEPKRIELVPPPEAMRVRIRVGLTSYPLHMDQRRTCPGDGLRDILQQLCVNVGMKENLECAKVRQIVNGGR